MKSQPISQAQDTTTLEIFLSTGLSILGFLLLIILI
jgi:hypothetical protein